MPWNGVSFIEVKPNFTWYDLICKLIWREKFTKVVFVGLSCWFDGYKRFTEAAWVPKGNYIGLSVTSIKLPNGGIFGQINCWQRLWKVAQSPINRPIWSHWIWTIYHEFVLVEFDSNVIITQGPFFPNDFLIAFKEVKVKATVNTVEALSLNTLVKQATIDSLWS